MWWFGQKPQLPTGMIDLHNHVAPGLDDGAVDDEETVALLNLFVDAGYTHIAITSHLGHPLFPEVTAERIREKTAHVQALAEEHQIPIHISPGAEIYYQDQFLQNWQDGNLLPLGGEGPYYLIEFTPSDPMTYMKELAFQLSVQGVRPILAHPERYHALQRNPALIQEWRNAGWLMQLDLVSLLASEGKGTRKLCKKYLKERAFDIAASDLHRPNIPPQQLQKMLGLLLRETDEAEAMRLLVQNPQRILAGQHTIEAERDED